MSTSQYLLGAAELAVIAAALGLGAYHLRALLVPAWTGALGRLAEVVIAISMLILISEVIGALGLMDHPQMDSYGGLLKWSNQLDPNNYKGIVDRLVAKGFFTPS